MNLWLLAIGSILVLSGRVYASVRAGGAVPLWWTLTGEVPLAFTILLYACGYEELAAWLWLFVGTLCFVVGLYVGKNVGAMQQHSHWWDLLTVDGEDSIEPIDLEIVRFRDEIRRKSADDPVFDKVCREVRPDLN